MARLKDAPELPNTPKPSKSERLMDLFRGGQPRSSLSPLSGSSKKPTMESHVLKSGFEKVGLLPAERAEQAEHHDAEATRQSIDEQSIKGSPGSQQEVAKGRNSLHNSTQISIPDTLGSDIIKKGVEEPDASPSPTRAMRPHVVDTSHAFHRGLANDWDEEYRRQSGGHAKGLVVKDEVGDEEDEDETVTTIFHGFDSDNTTPVATQDDDDSHRLLSLLPDCEEQAPITAALSITTQESTQSNFREQLEAQEPPTSSNLDEQVGETPTAATNATETASTQRTPCAIKSAHSGKTGIMVSFLLGQDVIADIDWNVFVVAPESHAPIVYKIGPLVLHDQRLALRIIQGILATGAILLIYVAWLGPKSFLLAVWKMAVVHLVYQMLRSRMGWVAEGETDVLQAPILWGLSELNSMCKQATTALVRFLISLVDAVLQGLGVKVHGN